MRSREKSVGQVILIIRSRRSAAAKDGNSYTLLYRYTAVPGSYLYLRHWTRRDVCSARDLRESLCLDGSGSVGAHKIARKRGADGRRGDRGVGRSGRTVAAVASAIRFFRPRLPTPGTHSSVADRTASWTSSERAFCIPASSRTRHTKRTPRENLRDLRQIIYFSALFIFCR